MSNYNESMNCFWIITAPSDKQVKFKFTDLALGSCEPACSSENCTYVELYDGATANSSLLKRFCNGSVVQDVFSRGSQMFVKFHSGFSLDRGFKAQYFVSSGRPTTTPSLPGTTPYQTTTPHSAKTPSASAPSAGGK